MDSETLRKHAARLKELLVAEVAPPGWENTVKRMKKHKDISNPFALAWYMKNKGDKPHKKKKRKKKS